MRLIQKNIIKQNQKTAFPTINAAVENNLETFRTSPCSADLYREDGCLFFFARSNR